VLAGEHVLRFSDRAEASHFFIFDAQLLVPESGHWFFKKMRFKTKIETHLTASIKGKTAPYNF